MDNLQDFKISTKCLQGLEVNIISGNWQVYDSTWGGMAVNDPFARLYWLRKGRGMVRFKEWEQHTVHLLPGRLYLFPPNCTADYTSEGDMELMWVHLTLRLSGMLDFFSAWILPVEVEIAEGSLDLSCLFSDLLSGCSPETSAEWLRADGAARYFLSFFLKHATERGRSESEGDERMRSILVFMRTHLHQPLQLQDLGKQVGLHPTYFSNLFSRTFGIPPMQYLNDLRIKTAQEFLRFTSLSTQEIAAKTGYDDPLYFSRCFKSKTGYSPTQYRTLDNRF